MVMVVAALTSMSISSTASEPVLLHAAGSLRAPLTEVVKTFAADTGLQVQPKFGASGLLKDEILSGAPAGVFASANLEHPKALAQAKRAGPVAFALWHPRGGRISRHFPDLLHECRCGTAR